MGHGDLYFIDKPPLEVRFSELLHAYDYEADTANNIYAGRHIKMECVIKEVIGNNGRTYINIGDLDSWTSQTAAIELMEFSKDLFRLNRGDRITIGGILSGGRSFTDIRLSNVYIIVMQRASEKPIQDDVHYLDSKEWGPIKTSFIRAGFPCSFVVKLFGVLPDIEVNIIMK